MPSATVVAAIFWTVALVGFVAASGGLWFSLGEWWRSVAFVSAIVSLVGIVLFFVVTVGLALPGAVILAVENLRGVSRPRAPELR
jgi:hypothetical protein